MNWVKWLNSTLVQFKPRLYCSKYITKKIIVSIPLWFNSNQEKNLKVKNLFELTVSIPLWFNSNRKKLLRKGWNLSRCLNSTLVQFKLPKIRLLKLPQLIVSIPLWFNSNQTERELKWKKKDLCLNSTLVQFKHLCYILYQKKEG